MAWHVSSFHLDLGQLWQCPVSWCTQWKGTPEDHICKKHFVDDSAKAANLGRWFPCWTATKVAWHMALKSNVSGVSTDAALFSVNGSQLVHHYWVFGQCAAHVSLPATFMIDLRHFTARASADAKWTARWNRILGTGSQRHRVHKSRCLAVSDGGGRMAHPRFAKPPGRCPRS